MSLLDAPFPKEWTVGRGRDAYLAENGFTVEAYDAKWTEGSFLGIPVAAPNTRHHRWAIMLPDLHHVATGYGTDLAGEAELAAWEIRYGARALGLYVGSIVLSGVLLFDPSAPLRTVAAWKAARSTRSLYMLLADVPTASREGAYQELLGSTVRELRERLGIPLVWPRGRPEASPQSTNKD
jgi:hypothetical protein